MIYKLPYESLYHVGNFYKQNVIKKKWITLCNFFYDDNTSKFNYEVLLPCIKSDHKNPYYKPFIEVTPNENVKTQQDFRLRLYEEFYHKHGLNCKIFCKFLYKIDLKSDLMQISPTPLNAYTLLSARVLFEDFAFEDMNDVREYTYNINFNYFNKTNNTFNGVNYQIPYTIWCDENYNKDYLNIIMYKMLSKDLNNVGGILHKDQYFKNYKMEDLLIQTHDLETPDKLEFWNEHWESQKYYDWTILGPLKKYKQENL